MVSYTTQELKTAHRLCTDFGFFAENVLKIRTKGGETVPFVLNKAQEYIHERIEEQLKTTGRVRAIILKGRQQGCSTYVGGRYYWKSTTIKGQRVFILTHEDEATKNLFGMAHKYHELDWRELSTGAASEKELYFDQMDSGYKVGTARTKGTGRSQTIQCFHGSEVAFWTFAETHVAGVLQAVGNNNGSEVILESTANGIGNFYHKMWQEAEAGVNGYLAIFVPWYWQDEYQEPVPSGFTLSPEEKEYQAAYNLTIEQMVWRRNKERELGEWLFKQEYPANAAEAFQTSGEDSFIKPESVLRARKAPIPFGVEYAARTGGLDIARMGGDRTVLSVKQGRQLLSVEIKREMPSLMDVVSLAIQGIRQHNLRMLFIDVGGMGIGVYDRLVELGYGRVVTAVNSASASSRPQVFKNKRAEMIAGVKEWLDEDGAKIPDSDLIQADFCAPSYKYDSNQRLIIESKEDMRARGLASTDILDSVALNFAYPIAGAMHDDYETHGLMNDDYDYGAGHKTGRSSVTGY